MPCYEQGRLMTKASKRLAMVQLDVFSSQPLEGNPLAVFSDGRGLSDGEMQAIAREIFRRQLSSCRATPLLSVSEVCVYGSLPSQKNCLLPAIPRWARRS